jgi:phosphoglycolate phosphatase-like HAD superfamily hydrolase
MCAQNKCRESDHAVRTRQTRRADHPQGVEGEKPLLAGTGRRHEAETECLEPGKGTDPCDPQGGRRIRIFLLGPNLKCGNPHQDAGPQEQRVDDARRPFLGLCHGRETHLRAEAEALRHTHQDLSSGKRHRFEQAIRAAQQQQHQDNTDRHGCRAYHDRDQLNHRADHIPPRFLTDLKVDKPFVLSRQFPLAFWNLKGEPSTMPTIAQSVNDGERPDTTVSNLIIFDVDGTLVGGERHDWACFDQAIAEVTGFTPTKEFWNAQPEITAQAIAQACVQATNLQPGVGLEERIRDGYLRRLRQVHAGDPQAFPARDGVVSLLRRLSLLPGVEVAIATGDWLATSSFKLAAAGIDVSGYPMATSSDCSQRSEIIKLAAMRAGRSLADAVYVGDGLWDLKACRDLGMRFIGTGTRPHLLKAAGAQHILEVLEEALFLAAVQAQLNPGCATAPLT